LKNKEKVIKLENEFENSKNLLFKFADNPNHFNVLLQKIIQSVFKTAYTSDKKRDLKLSKLIGKTYTNFNDAKIINNTGITIPPNVLSLLKRGSEFVTGGSTRDNSSDIYLELNELFKTFRAQARKSGVSEINIEHIRSYTSLCGKDVSTCYTKDDKITDFFNF
jgi:hypothetical protein